MTQLRTQKEALDALKTDKLPIKMTAKQRKEATGGTLYANRLLAVNHVHKDTDAPDANYYTLWPCSIPVYTEGEYRSVLGISELIHISNAKDYFKYAITFRENTMNALVDLVSEISVYFNNHSTKSQELGISMHTIRLNLGKATGQSYGWKRELAVDVTDVFSNSIELPVLSRFYQQASSGINLKEVFDNNYYFAKDSYLKYANYEALQDWFYELGDGDYKEGCRIAVEEYGFGN